MLWISTAYQKYNLQIFSPLFELSFHLALFLIKSNRPLNIGVWLKIMTVILQFKGQSQPHNSSSALSRIMSVP